MSAWLIGKALSPLAALAFAMATAPVRRAVERGMKNGRLKRLLLMKVN